MSSLYTTTANMELNRLRKFHLSAQAGGGEQIWEINEVLGVKLKNSHSNVNAPLSVSTGWACESGGMFSYTQGERNIALGNRSHAQGYLTKAEGEGAHAGGLGFTEDNITKQYIIASGIAAFNHSTNTIEQQPGRGARGDHSAILGGLNADIPETSPRSVLLGGNGLKAPENKPDTAFAGQFESLIPGEGITIASANGTRWKLSVSDAGVLQITSL